jgi:hypothetical protein
VIDDIRIYLIVGSKDVFSFQMSQRKRFAGSMLPASYCTRSTFQLDFTTISLCFSKKKKNPEALHKYAYMIVCFPSLLTGSPDEVPPLQLRVTQNTTLLSAKNNCLMSITNHDVHKHSHVVTSTNATHDVSTVGLFSR